MGFNLGIIGLPNVGKSTIFNALSAAGAEMANYPFTTIEPNRGIVEVPDQRLHTIARILHKENPIPTKIEFVDLAGLVKGASRGEGLGNQFLGNIRTVDAVVHVVRLFRRDDVVHTTGDIDPVRDVEIIKTELLLSDLEILQRAFAKQQKLARSGQEASKKTSAVMEKAIGILNAGTLLKSVELSDEERALFGELGLISLKPVLYCANVGEEGVEEDTKRQLEEYARSEGSGFISILGKLEEEISELPAEEKQEYLKEMGIGESGLERLVASSYAILDLITYFTAATQLQAWTLKRGTRALDAAGRIHTDFAQGFIRAEVYSFDDLTAEGSEHLVREKGKLRSEGKEYVVQDGDIIRFLFNL
jgi:GTP-binding protein YchF